MTLNFANTAISSRIFIKPFSILRLVPGLFIFGFVCFGFNGAYAHDVKPGELRIILGGSRSFTVADAATCSALISVDSSDVTVATVSPTFIDAVTANFTVQASGSNTGEVTILVSWVGEDVGKAGGFCKEISSKTLTVKVIDPNQNSSGNNNNSGEGNDPVNTFNGELYFTEPFDLYLDGPIPLYFQRYYASHLAKSFVIGDLGDNWLHNYDWNIHWVGNVITLVTNKGKVLKYLSDGNGNWTLQSATDMPIPLVQEMTEILLRNPEDNYIYRFNAEGKLASIFDGKGNVLTFTYLDVFPDWRKLGEVTDGLGRSLVFTYRDVGNLRKIGSVREKQGSTFRRSVNFTYDSVTGEQHLKTVQDARFGSTTYTYKDTTSNADKALLLSKTFPRFNIPLRQTYFGTGAQFDSGKVETQADADNNVTTFAYSGANTTMTDPAAATIQHSHDSSGSLTSSTDKLGNVINITNDGSKRRTGVQDALSNSTLFNFDAASGMVNSFTDKNGNTTTYSYGSRTVNAVAFRDVTGIGYADGTAESLTYDASGNLVSHTDQAANTWTYGYNSRGQLTSITNPLSGVTSMTYSGADGTRASLTDAGSNTTTFAYDNNKRMDVTTYADSSTASRVFNAHNKPTSSTDEKGNTTQRTYDANGNLTRVTDASGVFITHTYDTMDRVVSTTDALGNNSTVAYDSLSRPTVFTNRQGLSSTSSYDLTGNITQVVDRGGFSWRASFAGSGNVASTTNPLNEVTSYQYDPEGNLTSRSTPLGNQTLLTYDSMNRMSSQRQPAGEVTSFGYEARGLVNNISLDPLMISTTIAYDSVGNVTSITDPNSQLWQRGYDPQGRLIQRIDPLSNITSFIYDNRNRVSKVTYPGGMGTLDILYDLSGNLFKKTYSDGLVIDYAHNVNDLRTTALNNTSGHNVNFAFDARHDLSQSNGLLVTRDAESRIKTIKYTGAKTLTYNYNNQGLLVSVQDWAAGAVSFGYDNARRLTNIIRPNGVMTAISRDADGSIIRKLDGNLLSFLTSHSSITVTRDANARVSSIERTVPLAPTLSDALVTRTFDNASQQTGFTYDAMGRLTADSNRSYVWNLASQLTSYTENSTTVNFSYDAFGMLVSRGTRDYIWNWALGTPSVSTIRDSSTDTRYYIYTPDGQLIYSIEASDDSRHYYHYDQNGNTLYLTDDGGAITNAYAYSPYGEILNSTGSFDNPFTFNGRYGVIQEGDSGLYLMRRRIYDASNGRFVSREPIADQIHPRTVNPYQFAARDPSNFLDPRGEDPKSSSTRDAVGLGATLTGGAAFGAGVNAPTASTLIKPPGSSVGTVAKGLGAAASLVGTAVEIDKAFDRMDTAENKYRQADEAAWDDFKRKMKEIGELYRSKENRRRPEGQRFTWDKYKQLRHALKEALDYTLETNQEVFEADAIYSATVLALNGATGLLPIPGVGLVLDWDNVLSDYRPSPQ